MYKYKGISMGAENLYDRIHELFGRIPANLNILQEQIDVDLQMEYFEQTKRHKELTYCKETILNRDALYSHETSVEGKKEALLNLASTEDVDAYRAIESFLDQPENGLKEWATLALQESRMLLESRLLDENQLLISTGLGGKGSKLRYFLVLIIKNEIELDENRKKIVHGEFEYLLKKNDAEIESMLFHPGYVSILVLIPLQIPVKELFKQAIAECNQFGDFIRDTFILTNIKLLSDEEIIELIEITSLKEKPEE
jgi:hypothetical protein